MTKSTTKEWDALLARIRSLETMFVKVGILASKGGDARTDDGDLSMIELAAIHEFGSPAAGIPERSFIRRTFATKKDELAKLCEKLARAVITGKMPIDQALALVGAWGVAAVKKTVTEGSGVPPPLKKATIARKGSDRPLVDTGRLLGALAYEVVKGTP
jgi:hypothetical protein